MLATVALALLALAAAAASPASAQAGQLATPEGSALPRDDGSLYRGAYEVTEDGALIYSGDVEYRCEDLVRWGAPAKPGSEDVTVDGSVVEPLTREAVELCAEAGFPPEGADLGGSAPPSASATAGARLPETGGPAPPAAVGLLLAGALLLAFRARRRS